MTIVFAKYFSMLVTAQSSTMCLRFSHSSCFTDEKTESQHLNNFPTSWQRYDSDTVVLESTPQTFNTTIFPL